MKLIQVGLLLSESNLFFCGTGVEKDLVGLAKYKHKKYVTCYVMLWVFQSEGEERPLGSKWPKFSLFLLLIHGGGMQAHIVPKAKWKDRARPSAYRPPVPCTALPECRPPILGTACIAHLTPAQLARLSRVVTYWSRVPPSHTWRSGLPTCRLPLHYYRLSRISWCVQLNCKMGTPEHLYLVQTFTTQEGR